MRVDRFLLLLLAAFTAGCADPEPFVDFDEDVTARLAPQVNKPIDPVVRTGSLRLCFSDKTPWAEVAALAVERCAAHGLQAKTDYVQRYQCRATSPHRAVFVCYDPEMMSASGTPVNPFDPNAVAAWERETGKTAKPHNFMTMPGGAVPPVAPPATVGPAAPPAAAGADQPPAAMAPVLTRPVPAPAARPAAPLNPADIGNRPPMPAPAPVPQAVPAPTPKSVPGKGAYPTEDGFTLPQGSWGDHFEN